MDDSGKLRLVDLFAGTGAFSTAFASTGAVETVYANDMVPQAKQLFDLNHNIPLTCQDITTVNPSDIPPHDILCGGFPCQPFSIAGKQLGFNDSRSNVFWKIIEILKHHQPQCIILENVKNLTTHDKGNTFKIIISELKKLGYNLKHRVLNTSSITTVPQHRERIYIVGLRDIEKHNKMSLEFPLQQKQPIKNLLESSIEDKYYYSKPDNQIHQEVCAHVTNHETVYQWRRVYVRSNKNNECPTLTANMGSGGHNVPLVCDNIGARKLTPRECFNFQGFDSTFRLPQLADSHLYKLAGNAVSVPVVKKIAERIVPLLSN